MKVVGGLGISVIVVTRLQVDIRVKSFNSREGHRLFPVWHSIQAGSEFQKLSYPAYATGSFCRDKAARELC
jgi:hypothetical protein